MQKKVEMILDALRSYQEVFQSFGLSSNRYCIVVLWPEPIWSKSEYSLEEKEHTWVKKHKWILFREVHFWTKIWSGWGSGLRAWTETCDDSSGINGDGCKITCLYGKNI